MTLKQIVAFCILMEGDGGILNKAPTYIYEKFIACKNRKEDNELLALLDYSNQKKFQEYMRRWNIKEDFDI